MSKNIKEIGKELLGKSLNSFHRKTGLIQLEKNNEMQDGILDGILSQVDDAYIDKTEQSNVIHLDGSGDGVVVLDSIEGNTMVNIVSSYDNNRFRYLNATKLEDNWFKLQHSSNENSSNIRVIKGTHIYKPNTTYTIIVDIKENTANARLGLSSINSCIDSYVTNFPNLLGVSKTKFTTRTNLEDDGKGDITTQDLYFCSWDKGGDLSNHITFRYWILEGDWTNRELPSYFEGLKSSFEDKVNNEGKYEIEILSNNGNIFDINAPIEPYIGSSCKVENESITVSCDSLGWYRSTMTLNGLKPNTTYYLKYEYESISGSPYKDINIHDANGYKEGSNANALPLTNGTFTTPNGCRSIKIRFYCGSNTTFGTIKYKNIMISDNDMNYTPRKYNKIKLLINEPLRGLDDNIKDKLLIKDNKLVIERNCNIYKLNSKDIIGYGVPSDNAKTVRFGVYWGSKNDNKFNFDASFTFRSICNILPYNSMWSKDEVGFYCDGWNSSSDDALRQIIFRLDKNIVGSTLNSLKDWIDNNEVIVVYKTLNPIYEEVLNEYGEPIILEGYENGTIYIDSTVIPTTTVRYTPKMESFKTLNEVGNNNTMLANDINDNIIPYMMDVDLMIMEKEMALPSQINIRKMEELDMTSMQKRTQDMLERLIKGKTLTEQECKTRVTTYLNAGKITDEQAEELMLVISEIYN